MKHLAAITGLAGALLFATAAVAQTPSAPPAAKSEPRAEPRPEAKKSAPTPTRKPPAVPETKPTPLPAATATPAPDNPNVDLVYGAFQRGEYKTAFNLATQRAQAGDPKAMTMLGEIYANGFGTKRDYAKAVDW